MKNLLTIGLLLLAVAGCGNGVTVAEGKAACATATACGIWPTGVIADGVTGCVTFVQEVNQASVAAAEQINADQVGCLAKAGANCALARKCLNGGQTPSACAGNSGTCDGNVLKTCSSVTGSGGNNGSREFDCGSVGLKCEVQNDVAACGSNTCDGFVEQCNGNVLETCDNGIETDYDCAQQASICVPGTLGTAACRGQGAGCTGTDGSALRCDGEVLVYCQQNQEARNDCTRVHESCVGTGTDARCGLAADCDPATTPAICMGNTLQFCNKGKNDTINCGANGFSGCDASNGGRCQTNTP